MTKIPDPIKESVGITAVQFIFLNDFKWAFRHQPVLDWGIDAHLEIIEHEKLTGKLIALQIKSGASYFRKKGGDYVYYGEQRHYDYWLYHSLPVFIILHNPDTNITIWQKFEPRLCKLGKNGWSIDIPSSNVLSKKFKRNFEEGIPSDIGSFRRFMLTIDLGTIRALASKDHFYVSVQEMLQKSLNMRTLTIRIDESTEKLDFAFNRFLPHSDLNELLSKFYPWMSCEHISHEDYFMEFRRHDLIGKINELGQAALVLEDYYQNGAEEVEVVGEIPMEGFEPQYGDENFRGSPDDD